MNRKLNEKFEEFLAELEVDADIIEYKAAKEAYENDRIVATKVSEYNVQTTLLDQESQKSEKDTLLIDSLKNRISVLYEEITDNETMKRMTAAEDKLSIIFNDINSGLQNIIAPGSGCSDDSCQGGCSSCSGCH
ncbi:MAG: YlbF family regulator [Eubacteriales bacterium]|nr:YlbF family regulator [Eubacteriales bacterium]MDD4421934.1 YlbF family regulator [Eubacteriales bacterium]HBR31129.1 hypothetical protein [Clostridiales bacterium]